MADVMGNEPLADPDAQATVTEFIDYTEHLPSDVRRSLALIEKLNEAMYAAQHEVHELTKRWNTGVKPTNEATAEEVSVDLRARISYQKNLSSRYAAAALAEAIRMNDEIARHQKLIKVTEIKLDALPLPPSRDPTPQPVQSQSPQAIRPTGGRGSESNATGPVIKLKIGNNRISASTRTVPGAAPRSRRKRVIVPGEVLPPPNPDSPTPSDISDWESPPPPVRATPKPEPRVRGPDKGPRMKAPKAPKPLKLDLPRPPKKERAPRPAGVMGTNVHSQVAGISTSNALALLTPPPADAPIGSEHAPWMRLTSYEMAKLRKRMKKNAIWNPSDTMIRRELNDAGRGPDAYRKAKQSAEEADAPFIDCDDIANRDPKKPLAPGEIYLEPLVRPKLINRGMSLNVQKKEKKIALQKQQAEQARLEAEQAARNLGQLGEQFKKLFEPDKPIEQIVLAKSPVTNKRKRKRESIQTSTEESQLHSQLHSEIIVTPTSRPGNTKKQRKATSVTPVPPKPLLSPALAAAGSSTPATSTKSTSITTTTTMIPLAAPASSPIKSPRETKESKDTKDGKDVKDSKEKTPANQAPSPPAPRRPVSLVIKPPAEPSSSDSGPPTSSRPQSRPASRRASAGPPPESSIRDRPRRKSATPGATAPHTPAGPPPTATLASRRAKRPAPGVVTNGGQDGGTAMAVGRRQKKPAKKPNKKMDAAAAQKEELVVEEEEPIDPNEPRYCLCGDVSYGTMVMCENQDCEKEWFHLECVGLSDIPSRRAKWWCPECSVKLGKTKA